MRRSSTAGPLMVRWLEATHAGAVPSRSGASPTTTPSIPAENRRRAILECPMFSYGELGEWAKRVTPSPYYPEVRDCRSARRRSGSRCRVDAGAGARAAAANDERGRGLALIGRLLGLPRPRRRDPDQRARDRARAWSDGAVAGVRLRGRRRKTRARDDVVLATGGFEWNDELEARVPARTDDAPASRSRTNTGDGLRMAMRAGAMLGNMREAWWMPVAEVPREASVDRRDLITGERTLPRCDHGQPQGKRFTNEAANYNAFGAAFHDRTSRAFEYRNLPCWMVFDQGYLDRYGFAGHRRQRRQCRRRTGSRRAPTLAALATKLGIPRDALERDRRALERAWSPPAATPTSIAARAAHDHWWGDAPRASGTARRRSGRSSRRRTTRSRSRAARSAPRAARRPDVNANVLDVDGAPIVGLYAAGNAMALADGHDLRRRRRHDRARHGVRVPGRAARGGDPVFAQEAPKLGKAK